MSYSRSLGYGAGGDKQTKIPAVLALLFQRVIQAQNKGSIKRTVCEMMTSDTWENKAHHGTREYGGKGLIFTWGIQSRPHWEDTRVNDLAKQVSWGRAIRGGEEQRQKPRACLLGSRNCKACAAEVKLERSWRVGGGVLRAQIIRMLADLGLLCWRRWGTQGLEYPQWHSIPEALAGLCCLQCWE